MFQKDENSDQVQYFSTREDKCRISKRDLSDHAIFCLLYRSNEIPG